MKKHTDSGFTFDIKEDHAAVMEIDGDPQIVEIPEQIDGVPVTELAEYLFSGKSCQVIRIPLGVQKIGRYGFYNCRNLEELWFSSDFTDLGSGAFTGCHRIRRMEVLMNGEKLGRNCGYIYMGKWKPCFGFRNIMRKVWKILLPGY